MKSRAGFRSSVLAFVALVTGCYSYVPVAPSGADPGSIVRADVTDEASRDLTSRLGPGILQVRGRVIDLDEQTLALLVDSYTSARAGELYGNGEAIRLPLEDFRQIEQKKFSVGRSVLLGLAFAAGAAAVTGIAIHESRVLENEENTDPNQQDRRRPPFLIHLFRIPFP